MYAVEAVGLSKTFRNRRRTPPTHAARHLDLHIDEGDLVALLGPNGAGKTTTIMMLLGVTEPDEGRVTLLGHPLPEERTLALDKTNGATILGRQHGGGQSQRRRPHSRNRNGIVTKRPRCSERRRRSAALVRPPRGCFNASSGRRRRGGLLGALSESFEGSVGNVSRRTRPEVSVWR